MNGDAFRNLRERAGLTTGGDVVLQLLGVLQVLLVPVALLLLGLIVELAESSGSARRIELKGSAGLTLARISLSEPAVEVEAEGEEETAAPSGVRSPADFVAARGALAILLAMEIGVIGLIVLIEVIRRRAVARRAARLGATMRRLIHRHIYRLGLSALPTQGIDPVLGLFREQVDAYRRGYQSVLNGLWRWPALVVVLVLLTLLLAWEVALFLISLGGLIGLATKSLKARSEHIAEAARRDAELQAGLLQEDLGQVRTVRVYGMEAIDNERFDEHLERHWDADERRLRAEGSALPGLLLMIGVAGALGAGLIAHQRLTGRIEDALVGLIPLIFGLVAQPILRIIDVRRLKRRGTRAAEAIERFLERRPELLQRPDARFLPPLKNRISVENVTVEGTNGRNLLEGISLEIPAGAKTAFMGRDEESKQALVCLIPRLLDPKIGRVRADGFDLKSVTLESLRAQIAIIFQSDLIFNDSVKTNIGLGDPSFNLPRIIEAAKAMHAHHVIQDLPAGYDTFVGSLGHYLRIDEQYRIALARAFLHDPSIVVIEEPHTQLDETIKPLIDDAVRRLCQGRTAIFLAHRLSTIRTCDRVVVLHNGRIEAEGTAKELQSESKIFRHLQYLEFNQFASGEIEAGQMHI